MECYEHNIVEPVFASDNSFAMTQPLYMVLEFCGHEDLREFQDRLQHEGKWSPEMVMRIYVQLLKGLADLQHHRNKWVHHDLKPENILIQPVGDSGEFLVKIIDMGGAVKGFRMNAFTFTKSSAQIAPPEWGFSKG